MAERGAHDLVVVGGGSGGLGAAFAAARKGARVAVVQEGPIGGECTFTGCVPSKALIEAAARGAGFGEAMGAVARAVATVQATETPEVLAREGIEVIPGRARFTSPTTVAVDGLTLRADSVVIATGSAPTTPAVDGVDRVDHLTSEEVFHLERQPRSLAILGGGPTGVEVAQAFSRLGTQVTVVEALDRLLPGEEPGASASLAEAFADHGIGVRLGEAVWKVEPLAATRAARLRLHGGGTVEADALLVATGRAPRTGGLGLEAAGVRVDHRGFVITDAHLRTTARGVWAVGDVCGKALSTHAAYEMGRIAATNALAPLAYRRFHPGRVPGVTFTDPEVARIGCTEAGAPRGARVAEVANTEVDRAVVAGETRGFCKLIVGPRRVAGNLAGGRVLGATVVGPRAGEVVHEVALAMRAHLFPAQLALTTHAYPTWSMAIQR
ncbi:MAG TPA: FAD-dependent oxidoreductase, partial [Acidimicrobiales bacterium]|nr:FAD-dependent oxidoreductase [Acidimicrobiales bacterium]